MNKQDIIITVAYLIGVVAVSLGCGMMWGVGAGLIALGVACIGSSLIMASSIE